MPRVEVITGSMFGGKSEELVRRLKRPKYKKYKIAVIKPADDTRQTREIFEKIDSDEYLATYKRLHKSVVSTLSEFKSAIDVEHLEYHPTIIAMDEVQFFGFWIIDAIKELLDMHDEDDEFTIIVSGLDKDFLGNQFGPLHQLMLIADEVKKLNAVCQKCEKRSAPLTYKIGGSLNKQKEVGDDIYQARCRACHKLPE
jgi:thymidine kinase